MKNLQWNVAVWIGIGLSLLITACGGGGGSTGTPPPTTYVLTVNSANPASGVTIGVVPADNNGATNGTTSFTRTYNSGASVSLTAPATSGGNTFVSWTGCTTANALTCTVTMNANATVTASYAVPATTYMLTVDSVDPASGVVIAVPTLDNNGAGDGTTSFTRTYNAGTTVTLTAPSNSSSTTFASWSGCTTASTVTCTVVMNANATVTANFTTSTGPAITSVTVTPNPATATIGTQVQFTATVAGTGNFSTGVTWSLAGPSGSSLSPGTLSKTGLYTTPYPAPATVTISATSTENVTKSGSVTVTLSPPAVASGPVLTVDAGNQTHAISPNIYGMNAYLMGDSATDAAAVAKANVTIDRWGGNSAERYNYQLDATNTIDDWFFENVSGTGGDGWLPVSGVKAFDALVESNNTNGITTLGTVPVLGWVPKTAPHAASRRPRTPISLPSMASRPSPPTAASAAAASIPTE